MRFIKYFSSFLFLIIIYSVSSFGQSGFSFNYQKYINAINFYSKSAVYLESKFGGGTGALILRPYNDSVGNPFIITAKHIFYKEDSLHQIIDSTENAKVLMKLKNDSFDIRDYSIDTYAIGNIDMVSLTANSKIRNFKEYDVTTINMNNGIAELSEIKRGQSVFIAGYPLHIGIYNSTPVVQSGIISYVDTTNLLVLIDIAVNHGNSGCPVYCINEKAEVKLLGLVVAYKGTEDEFVLYKNKLNPSDSIYRLNPVNSSLGQVVLVSPLLEDYRKIKNNK